MFLNSTASWQINSSYDLETVAIHEFGHALGLGESQITTACMYAYYNGMKQSLTTDDIAGIQSVWGAPQPDQFNSNGQSNGTLQDGGQYYLLHRQQRPDRDSQPADHQRQPVRMVLRHRTVVDDRHDGRDRCSRATSACMSPQLWVYKSGRSSSADRLGEFDGLWGDSQLFGLRVCRPGRPI